MSTFVTTLIIAFILVLLALAALAIGWLLTGKSKIEAGSCGRAPDRKKNESCGTDQVCPLCKDEKKK